MSMQFHDVANIFPMMNDDEYQALVADIQEHGLIEPIWVHEGEIIDGRNRYRACQELDIIPRFRPWDGQGSLVSFVVSLNLQRRHLSSSQRAMATPEIERALAKEARKRQGTRNDISQIFEQSNPNEGKAAEQAARMVGTNRQYVIDAKHISEHAPDLADQVRAGNLTIPEAKRELRSRQRDEYHRSAPVVLPDSIIIHHGRSTEHLVSNAYDIVFTDPPYGISSYRGITKVGDQLVTADFDNDEEWDSQDPEGFLVTLDQWVEEWARLLRPGGALIAFTDKALISHLWDACKYHELKPKNIITWCKPNINPAGLARKNLISSTEYMIWAVKPGAPYTFNDVQGWDQRNYISVPFCGNNERRGHPNQKPLALIQPLLQLVSKPGDLVVDPFAGSGSTGIAALRLGLRAHLIEQNEDYVRMAQAWLSEEAQGLPPVFEEAA